MGAESRSFGDPLEGHHKYSKLNDLSSGSFGFVQKCENKHTGEVVAIKFIKRGREITKYVEREVVNQASLFHPHVVGFKEVFLTQNHLAIVLEYVAGGNVLQYILKKGSLTEIEARRIFQQLVIGIDFLHQKGIVNRDIKLENTMLDTSTRPLVKVTDFGLCKSAHDSTPKSRVGTPGCMAPEVLTGRTYCGKLADAWSCGVMLYTMLFASYPFERLCDQNSPSAIKEVWRRILSLDYYLPEDIAVTSSCQDLIRKILVLEPSERLSIAQIQEHPWFKEGLPNGVDAMNQRYARVQPFNKPGYQSIRMIRDVIEHAREEADDSAMGHASSSNSNSSESLSLRQCIATRGDSMALV